MGGFPWFDFLSLKDIIDLHVVIVLLRDIRSILEAFLVTQLGWIVGLEWPGVD